MAWLLDMPSEILQQILRYAIPKDIELKLDGDTTLKMILTQFKLENPALSIILINKKLWAAGSLVPSTKVIVNCQTFKNAEHFIHSAARGTRRYTSRIIVQDFVDHDAIQRTHDVGRKKAIARSLLRGDMYSLQRLLSFHYERVIEQKLIVVWEETAGQLWAKAKWDVSGLKLPKKI